MLREKYELQVLWGRPASTVFPVNCVCHHQLEKGGPQTNSLTHSYTNTQMPSSQMLWELGKRSHVSQIRTRVEFPSGKAPCGSH